MRSEDYLGVTAMPERRAWMIKQIFRYCGHQWIYALDELRHAATEAGFLRLRSSGRRSARASTRRWRRWIGSSAATLYVDIAAA